MASSREERLQMRQRGAGTRKIKDVNFGFSFGSPLAVAPQQLSRQSPQPVPTPTDGVEPAGETQTPERQKPALQFSPTKAPEGLQGNDGITRTPGSSRNRLPERPSTFDIPLDEPPEQIRSSKRRRVGPAKSVPGDAPVPLLQIARPEHSTSPAQGAITNGNGTRPDGGTVSISVGIPHINGTEAQDTSGQIAASKQDTVPVEQTTIPDIPENPPVVGNRQENQVESGEAVQNRGQKKKRGKRTSILQQPPDRRQSFESTHGQENGKEAIEPSPETQRPESPNDAPTEEARESEKSPQGRESRRRRRAEGDTTTKAGQVNGEIEDQTRIRRSGRRRAVQVQTTDKEGEKDAPPEPVVQKEPAAPASADVPEPEPDQQATHEGEERDLAQGRPRRRRREKQNKTQNTDDRVMAGARSVESPEEPHPEPDPEPEPSPTEERSEAVGVEVGLGRQEADQEEERGSTQAQPPPKRRKQKQTQNTYERGTLSRIGRTRPRQPQPQPEPEPEQEPEEQSQVDPRTSPRQNRRRGRPSGSKNATAKSKPRNGQSSGQQGEEDEENGKSKRGETVPVTVHRLANVAALGSLADDSAASSDEQESSDEFSTRKKFPNRGGVNAADVLSQICRETLDKTLTTLKNGIEKESNAARRAEWTRKRKAVEAYGAELDGRLFEMSEMLDSNFVLNMQLKKAKREMGELRNRLLQVRQQRQDVALRMDEVRRKHSEEESAKMSRNAINNSVHNLELVLDRNKLRNVEDTNEGDDSASLKSASSVAGLEFLLRTVADNVSSIAPGAQGGLLNQVKAFNAELEMAAKRLESS